MGVGEVVGVVGIVEVLNDDVCCCIESIRRYINIYVLLFF